MKIAQSPSDYLVQIFSGSNKNVPMGVIQREGARWIRDQINRGHPALNFTKHNGLEIFFRKIDEDESKTRVEKFVSLENVREFDIRCCFTLHVD